MALAILMSRRSMCPGGVGAVIADRKQRVVSTGYTGPPARFPDDWDCMTMCPRRTVKAGEVSKIYGLACPTAHAEQNAISFADRSRAEGGTLYISSVPCEECAKIIANSGVARAVWRKTTADLRRGTAAQEEFLRKCKLKVDIL